MFCDTCDQAVHMDCLDPPMLVLPKGDYKCPECITSTTDPELWSTLHPLVWYRRRRNEDVEPWRLCILVNPSTDCRQKIFFDDTLCQMFGDGCLSDSATLHPFKHVDVDIGICPDLAKHCQKTTPGESCPVHHPVDPGVNSSAWLDEPIKKHDVGGEDEIMPYAGHTTAVGCDIPEWFKTGDRVREGNAGHLATVMCESMCESDSQYEWEYGLVWKETNHEPAPSRIQEHHKRDKHGLDRVVSHGKMSKRASKAKGPPHQKKKESTTCPPPAAFAYMKHHKIRTLRKRCIVNKEQELIDQNPAAKTGYEMDHGTVPNKREYKSCARCHVLTHTENEVAYEDMPWVCPGCCEVTGSEHQDTGDASTVCSQAAHQS